MRVAILVPSLHFHAPFVLCALPRSSPAASGGHEYLAVLTPKLSPRRAPLWVKVRELVGRSGMDYCASMAALRAFHALRGGAERLFRVPLARRRSLSVEAACAGLGARVARARSVRDRETLAILRDFAPDILCSVFFNQIVPRELIDLPRLGAVNLHPSYLPSYRGVSPCLWVLARGESSTGVTVHRLTEEIDQGEILARARVEILPNDSVDSLYRRCASAGGELLAGIIERPERLAKVEADQESEASYFSSITREAVQQLRAQGRSFF